MSLLFCSTGATLAAIGVVPEIAVIGVVGTEFLSLVACAALGCVVGYLTDVVINKCCSEPTLQAA
ncbi:MAG: hypothetical protein PV340_01025 [Wolbachia sp.]|nr:hypothetical protein [Wolbachia sp.]MDD9336442.1 hypothetical protein [Wolbachia sp.]